MRIENAFEVAASPDAAWALLVDVPRVIPCMPGATLDEVVDDASWKATMQVKLGPIGLTFATDVKREEMEEAERRVKLAANAREVRNRGRATATIESRIAAVDGGSRVELVTELGLSGPVAQYGRGMIQDISSQLVESFAECLRSQLAAAPEQAAAAVAAQSEPVQGLSLAARSVRRGVARAFGKGSTPDEKV
jgi:carbon monoxide dehydrogenase subunit G